MPRAQARSLCSPSGSSGSSCAGGSSPRSTSSDKVGKYSLEGLAATWDNIELARSRLRDSQNLVRHWDSDKKIETDDYVGRTTANLKINAEILSPILKTMKENNQLIPIIDQVMEQVRALFVRAKVPHNGDRVYTESWALRRLLSLMKAQTWKDRNPQDETIRGLLRDLGCDKGGAEASPEDRRPLPTPVRSTGARHVVAQEAKPPHAPQEPAPDRIRESQPPAALPATARDEQNETHDGDVKRSLSEAFQHQEYNPDPQEGTIPQVPAPVADLLAGAQGLGQPSAAAEGAAIPQAAAAVPPVEPRAEEEEAIPEEAAPPVSSRPVEPEGSVPADGLHDTVSGAEPEKVRGPKWTIEPKGCKEKIVQRKVDIFNRNSGPAETPADATNTLVPAVPTCDSTSALTAPAAERKETTVQLVMDISDDEDELLEASIKGQLAMLQSRLGQVLTEARVEEEPAKDEADGARHAEGGEFFEHTDYMSKQLARMDELEKKMQTKEAALQHVPDHPAITRRLQFQVKNSLKKEKDDRKRARQAKEGEGEGEEAHESEDEEGRKKGKGKGRRRGGGKDKAGNRKTTGKEKEPQEKKMPKEKKEPNPEKEPKEGKKKRKEQKGPQEKKEPQKKKDGKDPKDEEPKEEQKMPKEKKEPNPEKEPKEGKKKRKEKKAEKSEVQPDASEGAEAHDPNKPSRKRAHTPSAKSTRKGKPPVEKLAGKSRPTAAKSKPSPKDARQNRRTRSMAPATNVPEPLPISRESVAAALRPIFRQCQRKNKCCEDHSRVVTELCDNVPGRMFQKSVYWTRPAVGLVVPTDHILPEDVRNPNKATQEVSYFSGGPCVYADAALTDLLVEAIEMHMIEKKTNSILPPHSLIHATKQFLVACRREVLSEFASTNRAEV